MRTMITAPLFLAVSLSLGGCPRPLPPDPNLPTMGNAQIVIGPAVVDEIARDDRVSAGENPNPDGRPDAQLSVRVRGRVSNIIVTLCDDVGTHTSTQWDTVVGQNPLPEGFINRRGVDTWVLGVVNPDGRMINRGDGSIPEQDFGNTGTPLRLYAAMRDAVVAGRYVCVTIVRPDGSTARASTELR